MAAIAIAYQRRAPESDSCGVLIPPTIASRRCSTTRTNWLQTHKTSVCDM